MGLLFNELAITPQGYNIANSLRFQSASSNWMNRTPAGVGTSNKIMTFSAWVKRGAFATLNGLFTGSGGTVDGIQFWNNNIDVFFNNGATRITTSAVYRDPSAWYHIVVTVDTPQASAADRVRIYVNGSQVTATTGTAPAQNYSFSWNQNNQQRFGTDGGSNFFDGYTAEVNVIDGQALTPSSFGQTNTLTGQWVAKKYTGTYGTNGFYLPFSNGTSTTTLGADSSGNSNNWTLNNFTRSAGVSDCWMRDVPSGNGGPSGTQPSSNYAVMNPLNISGMSITRGNLSVSQTATAQGCRSSFLMTSGQWYWEVTNTTASSFDTIGIVGESISLTSDLTTASLAVAYYAFNGNRYVNGSAASYGATYTTNDVIGVAVDITNNTVTFYKNGASQGTITGLSLSGGSWYATNGNANNGANTKNYNFGQRSFAYTPPSGFKALCTANLSTPVVANGNKHFDVNVYVGDGSASRSITNSGGFAPGFIWHKDRSSTFPHRVWDVVRGATNFLDSASTGAESVAATGLLSFDSTGFTVGTGTSVNGAGLSIAAWQWNAGSSTVTNTSGTISSQVRANPTAGVSVVTYTGTGANATVGHGLGVAPSMIIVKNRNQIASWRVYHKFANASPASGNLFLQATNAFYVDATSWNNTVPTSSVFSVGSNGDVNASTIPLVAYCFAEIAGFSKFGSYTGNSNPDGAFVYTGFRPKYIMIKRTDSTSDWVIKDTSRSLYNVSAQSLQANLTTAETATDELDILSNGFKLRHSAASGNLNTSGGTYIYMAFAESPFNYSNAR